jgi:hypothetical protein
MSEPRKSRIDPSIIAAVIGVCGTVMVTLITLLVNWSGPTPAPTPPTASPQLDPTWTAVPTLTNSPEPIPTDTVPVGDASSTPAPDTATPEPTLTLAPPPIGQDWANDCISVSWIPFPSLDTTETNGCRSQPIHSLFAANGRLEFVIQSRFEDTEQYGMFAKLPASGLANIDVFLTNLQDGEIWLGVFAEPNIDSQGIIVVIPSGDVKNRPLVLKTMPGQAQYFETQSFAQSSAIYNVEFQFRSGSVGTVIMHDTPVDPLPVGSTEQWLFVGYQVKKGNNRMQAAFLNLVVQEQ